MTAKHTPIASTAHGIFALTGPWIKEFALTGAGLCIGLTITGDTKRGCGDVDGVVLWEGDSSSLERCTRDCTQSGDGVRGAGAGGAAGCGGVVVVVVVYCTEEDGTEDANVWPPWITLGVIALPLDEWRVADEGAADFCMMGL